MTNKYGDPLKHPKKDSGWRLNDGIQTYNCDICHMGFTSYPGDRAKHIAFHKMLEKGYRETIAKYKGTVVTWFRPRPENRGIYDALEELNPSRHGFKVKGLSDVDWQSIQDGTHPLPKGDIGNSASGHTRGSHWMSPDGTNYSWGENARAGVIYFHPINNEK